MFTLRSRIRGWRGERHPRLIGPALNRLEDRIAPAQLVVTSSLDDGSAGTLRSIVAIANTNSEADTITFDASVTSITLATGQLTISESKDLTIDGGGTVTINGAATPSATNRLLSITAKNQPSISLRDITLTKGHVVGPGGAIEMNDQSLHLEKVVFVANSASLSGGAVAVNGAGTLSINDSVFDSNLSGRDGGAVAATATYSNVSVVIDGSLFTRNTALRSGAIGIGSVAESVFYVQITNSRVSENQDSGKTQRVGTITLLGQGNCIIEGTTVDNNRSSDCGGIMIFGEDSSTTFINNCTIANNLSGGFGTGGLYCMRGTLVMTNSTVARNNADDNLSGRYGALMLSNCNVAINNCTIAGNGSAKTQSAGILAQTATVTFESCIIANNQSETGPRDIATAFTNVNLINSILGATNSALISQTDSQIGTASAPLDPGLLPLGSYGGPTPTMGLKSTSIALDKGSNPSGLMFDQRGQPREVPTGMPDIGAFEGVVAPARVSTVQINDGSNQRSIVESITVQFDLPIALPSNPSSVFQLVRQSDNAAVALDAISNGNSVTLTFAGGPLDFGSLADGRYTLTVLASQVTSGYFDGNGDGIAGDNYVLIGNPTNGLFRLFGDADGDGRVNAVDWATFRSSIGSPNPVFDFNNDGIVNATDFAQFRLRFGVMI